MATPRRNPPATARRTDAFARLTLIYWRERGGYVGQLEEEPEVISQGKTLEALRRNIRDAWQLVKRHRKAAARAI